MTATGSPRLSVITPVLNGRRFIEGCLRNVVEQDRDDIEHIVVDGGSTDGTVDVIEEYARLHRHIRRIDEQPGQSKQMNRGIAEARGRILGFLNVDDRYAPGTLRKALALFASLEEPSLVVGHCSVIDDDGGLLYVQRPTGISLEAMLVRHDGEAVFPVNPSAYFYHRSLHDSVGLYDPDDHYTMDADFLLRAVGRANLVHVDDVWGNFLLHPDCKTMQDRARGTAGIRFRRLVARYRRRLPWRRRLRVEMRSIRPVLRASAVALGSLGTRPWRT